MAATQADTSFCFILTLIRHGETEANKDRVIQGQLDSPLAPNGCKQATLLSHRLASECITHVYSSDLIRARETANIALMEVKPVPHIVEDMKLRERHYGSCQGGLIADYLKEAKSLGLPAYMYTPPGAETYNELQARGEEFFVTLCQHLATGHGQLTAIPNSVLLDCSSFTPPPVASVAVFTHGGLIRATLEILRERYGCQLPKSLVTVCPNTGLSVFAVSCQSDGMCTQVTCHRMFCTQHLDQKV